MPNRKLRVAIVGAGRMASSIDDEIREHDTWLSLKRQLPYSHAPCYRALDHLVEMVAVCDPVEEKCRTLCERWDVPRYYVDYREMIERERPDIVSIAVPASLHAEIAVFAMEHGARGIYCEKAMCCSLAEADAIARCAERHDAKFMLGAQRRHHPNFRRAREIITSGEIGELVGVYSWIEGALLHTLSHLADNSLYLAGDVAPVSVYGVLTGLRPRSALDEIEARRVASDLQYDAEAKRWSGDPGCSTFTARLSDGTFLVHMPAFMDVRWEAVCTNGYVRIVDNNDTLQLYRRRGKTYSFDRVELAPTEPASSHLGLVRDLVACVTEGGVPLANETVGRYGMEILMGVAQSHLAGGREVRIDEIDREMSIPSH